MPDANPAIPSDSPGAWRARRLLFCIPALLLLLSEFVPLSRELTSNDIDWPILLDDLHAQGAAFGRDVVFTFGPWGFIWAGASPQTLAVSCIAWAGLAITVWLVLSRVCLCAFPHSAPRAGMVLLLLALPLGGDYLVAPDVRLLLLAYLLLLYHFLVEPDSTTGPELLLVAAIAFAGLIKFTCFVAGAVAIAAVTIDQLLRHQRRLIPLVGWVGTTLLFWVAARQNPRNLPAHLYYSLSMTAGYADVMSLNSRNEARQIAQFVVPALWLILLLAPIAIRTMRRRAIGFLGGMLALLLITFRCGYVRHDQHELTSTMLLLIIVAICFAITSPALRKRGNALAWVLCVVVAAAGAWQSLADWHASSLPRQIAQSFGNFADEAMEVARLAQGRKSMVVAQRDQQLQEFQSRDPLPTVTESADLYPRLAIALLAHGIPYNPRPTIQSYAATTTTLTRLNALHLEGPNPPEHIFIDSKPTSEHFPALLDNRSWPVFLSHYQLEELAGSQIHLIRRPQSRTARFEIVSEITTSMGNRVEIPDELVNSPSLYWARIRVQRSGLGSAAAQLYKLPQLSIAIITADGRSQRWRFIPDLAADGFLIGPVINDPETLSTLLAPDLDLAALAPRMPRSLAVGISGDTHGRWYYAQRVLISFYRLQLLPPPR